MKPNSNPQPRKEIDLDSLPLSKLLDDIDAASGLDLSPGTLSVWRSTGRYNLPYHKIGREVRYRVSDLIAWRDSRQKFHTGQ